MKSALPVCIPASHTVSMALRCQTMSQKRMTHPYCVVQISNISQCSTMVFVNYFVLLWNKIFTTIYTEQTPQHIYRVCCVCVWYSVACRYHCQCHHCQHHHCHHHYSGLQAQCFHCGSPENSYKLGTGTLYRRNTRRMARLHFVVHCCPSSSIVTLVTNLFFIL